MNAIEIRIRTVAKAHRPRGWKICERDSEHCDGMAVAQTRKIYCPYLRDPYALYVYLHEVAHVLMKHTKPGRTPPEEWEFGWLEEYEAETFAFATMRVHGFRVKKDWVDEARTYVADMFNGRHDPADLDHPHYRKALRFAFPKTWRDQL